MPQTVIDHIEQTPSIAGGKPRIVGHRITVANVVVWHERLGKQADEIAAEHGLSLADIYAALTYYFDHREEIDTWIAEDNLFIEALREQSASKLPLKIRGKD